ncbi:hypothetical protein [Leuconostoc fallax]|uniref:hypothetical protein n=1 Tax=Leuconostoc fallax TaxID=1251 RepID=UPI001C1EF010|nr:hypothetical protein [Leuconostoc fallax]MBU7455692.1 hypothetical protein [Leuconostoc fallax]
MELANIIFIILLYVLIMSLIVALFAYKLFKNAVKRMDKYSKHHQEMRDDFQRMKSDVENKINRARIK